MSKLIKKIKKNKSRSARKLKRELRRGRGRPPAEGSGGQCQVCKLVFTCNSRLINHKRKFHNVAIRCGICSKTFNSSYKLKYHMDRHGSSRAAYKWPCSVCNTLFQTRLKLRAHFELDHHTSHGCERCGKVFDTRTLYKKHVKTDCEAALQCDTCGHRTKDKQAMRAHLIRHFRIEDVFVCMCGLKFITKKLLDGHAKSHKSTVEMNFVCEACGKQYDKYASIRKHRLSFHPDLFPCLVYKCQTCKFVTKCKETFERHESTHLSVKHVCEVCGKALSSSTALRIHSNIHTGHKPYACEICGKKFTSPNYLRKHHVVHDNSHFTKHSIQCRKCLRYVPETSYKTHESVCAEQKKD